jgi:hypothetical protein
MAPEAHGRGGFGRVLPFRERQYYTKVSSGREWLWRRTTHHAPRTTHVLPGTVTVSCQRLWGQDMYVHVRLPQRPRSRTNKVERPRRWRAGGVTVPSALLRTGQPHPNIDGRTFVTLILAKMGAIMRANIRASRPETCILIGQWRLARVSRGRSLVSRGPVSTTPLSGGALAAGEFHPRARGGRT